MNPVSLIMLDDQPDGSGNHLTAGQRLNAFEDIWVRLSHEQKLELERIVDDAERS